MNTEDILNTIHRIYENNTDYPEVDSDDFTLRLGLVNDSIKAWESVENVKWRELFATKTGNIVTLPLDVPADFVDISSFLQIGSDYYSYEKNDNVMAVQRQNPSKKFFYITGSPGAYKININPAPSSGTYSYSYYKKASKMINGESVPELSKPMYIVYWVLARLYEADGRNDMVSFYEQKANDMLAEMIALNESPPFNNEFKITDDDIAYKLDRISFGL